MKNFKLFLAEGKKWGGDTFPKKGDLVKLEYQIKLKDYETIATIVKVGKPPLVMKLKPERVSSWDDKKKFVYLGISVIIWSFLVTSVLFFLRNSSTSLAL